MGRGQNINLNIAGRKMIPSLMDDFEGFSRFLSGRSKNILVVEASGKLD